MPEISIKIDPEARIFYFNNTLSIGWLSMKRSPVTVEEPDLILFDALANGKTESELQLICRNHPSTQSSPELAMQYITKRVNGYINHGVFSVLQNAPQASETSSTTATLPSAPPQAELDRQETLRVSKNFMLKPTSEGYEIWSPILTDNIALNFQQTLLLLRFSTGSVVGDVMEKYSQLNNIAEEAYNTTLQFLASGLLIKNIDTATEDSAEKNDEAILATTETVTQTSSTGKKPATSSIIPTETTLDGDLSTKIEGKNKTPIYFVTHTKNHIPLALGMMYAHIKEYNNGSLLEKYKLVPLTYYTAKEYLGSVYKEHGPGVWFFSNYIWSVDTNLEISSTLKAENKNNLMIHGGPSTPNYQSACKDFLKVNASVDIAVHGEGEVTIVKLLETLAFNPDSLDQVDGITYRSDKEIIRTGSRDRAKDLNGFPSPYLSGVFDNYGSQVDAAIIESNRGCPFGCTFCDWGSATNQKIRKFDLQRVKDEILWIAENKVRVLWIADANFGIYDRDIELAEWICELKQKYGFPREVVVNYTKNATKRLAKIVEVFVQNGICSQGIISIQSRDEETLQVINRKNIKTDKYNDLAKIFDEQGLPLSTDLMIGLPGITVEGFKDDLQYYFDKNVVVKAYPTQLLPNSPMADPDYIKKYAIKVDSDSMLTSTFSYTPAQLEEMKSLYDFYTLADGLSVLRYVLKFIQWEYNIEALEFLHKLHRIVYSSPSTYPAISFVTMYFQRNSRSLPGGWKEFYAEIANFSKSNYNIAHDSAFDTALKFNEMLMPNDGLEYPIKLELNHDVCGYFKEHSEHQENIKPLSSYPPTPVEIDDLYSFAHIDYASKQYDTHQMFWELQSPLSRNQSKPNFV